MRARERILEMFKDHSELSVKEITEKTPFCKQMIHYSINQLILAKKIERIGHTPKTIYRLISEPVINPWSNNISWNIAAVDDFLSVTAGGELLEGRPAFLYWCRQRSLEPEETLMEYGRIQQKYARYHDRHSLIHGLDLFTASIGYGCTCLNDLHFLDFDTMGKFGKTQLGTLVSHAKHGQNKALMERLMDTIVTRIRDFLNRQQPDAVGFVPPVVRRNFQLMKYIQSRLNLSLPLLDIRKISNTSIPQASLLTVGERRRNADDNFCVIAHKYFDKVVLIDDMVDSGASLNQIALKLDQKGIAGEVTGLAVVGNLKGFNPLANA